MKKETSNSNLEYFDYIMYVRVKEGVSMTVESMLEQYAAQKEMTGDDDYAVMVDGTNYSVVPAETRKVMANHNPPGRKATAIVCDKNLATLLLANFFINVNKPKVPTKLFADESDALKWLKSKLKK